MDYLYQIEDQIKGLGFEIIYKDFERPWGGFLVVNESQVQDFANKFFDGLNIDSLKIGGKLSPKILIIGSTGKLGTKLLKYTNRNSISVYAITCFKNINRF